MSSKAESTTIKDGVKAALTPRLRFPEFWDTEAWGGETLSGVATIVMGSSPKSESYNQSQKGLPLLQGNADIKNRLSAPRIFTSEITKECKIGDILLSVRAPVGSVAKSIHRACIGRGIAALRAKQPNSQEFIYQWLLSYEPLWGDISQGGTFDAVNGDDLKAVALAVPRPLEQQKIADCLTSVDELIAAQAQKVDALKTHKKGLMQQLFPREGETHPRLRFPELGAAGDWEVRPLNEVFSIFQGYAFSSNDSVEHGTRWLKIADVGIQVMNPHAPSFLPAEYKERFPRFLVREGDYVLALTRPILSGLLKIAQVDSIFDGALLNQRVGKLVTPHNAVFVFFLLQTWMLVNTIEKSISGNDPPNLSAQQIEDIKIFIPPPAEQQRIADCLISLDDLIRAQSQKLDALKTHKKGLMQQLFPSLEETEA